MIKKFNEFINEDFTDLYKRWKKKEVRKEDSLEIKLKQFLSTKYHPEDYYIENGLVCCKGDVVIEDGDLDNGKFPFKFGKVEGDFFCYDCETLTSLEGAPQELNQDFDCSECKELTSLEGAPEKVGGDFFCYSCKKLTSLEGLPKEVGGKLGCYGCALVTSLEGCPEKVGGDFSCSDDSISTLEGAPKEVGGDFHCCYCEKLISLEGAPEYVGGDFDCSECGEEFTKLDLPKGTIIKGDFITE